MVPSGSISLKVLVVVVVVVVVVEGGGGGVFRFVALSAHHKIAVGCARNFCHHYHYSVLMAIMSTGIMT